MPPSSILEHLFLEISCPFPVNKPEAACISPLSSFLTWNDNVDGSTLGQFSTTPSNVVTGMTAGAVKG